jgi:hypothetical protein
MTEDDIWAKTLEILQQQMTRATFNAWFKGSRLVSVQKSLLEDADTYTVEVASAQAVDWLEHRLKETIASALQVVVSRPAQLEFIAREQKAFTPLDQPEIEEAEPDRADAEFEGVYRNQELAIIQPDRVMVFPQYFRKKWWPLLGPTLACLVMELRQRCHFKSGRNNFKTTYKSLAKAIGVSERTIHRVLERDEAGNFENEYLGYFIKDIEVLKESDGKGSIRNLGTRFVIYLDEPLTPEDQARLQ